MSRVGLGSVVRSEPQGVRVAERLYGYFPMSTHFGRASTPSRRRGLCRWAEHRRALAGTYNLYGGRRGSEFTALTPEPQQVILRPLFGLSFFFLPIFLDDEGFSAPTRFLVSSASEQERVRTAFLLAQPGAARTRGDDVAPQHRPSSRASASTIAWSRTRTSASLRRRGKTVYADFTGSEELRGSVHPAFGRRARNTAARSA